MSVTPAALVAAFRKYNGSSGIEGVAFGPKEVAGSTRNNPLSVTFFVKRKLPVEGARTRLADGRTRLPKFVEVQGESVATDVAVIGADSPQPVRTRSQRQIFRAGGKVSNLQGSGTMGCLVRRRDSGGISALTNNHIGLDTGTVVAFPDFQNPDAVAGTTSRSVRFVADEIFLPLFDSPQTYIDVDCALIDISNGVRDRFSPDIPNFGIPAGIFTPPTTCASAYVNALINKPVFSYSWKSGSRAGVISHVYYVYQRSPQGMQRVACFLVRSADSQPPGIQGDSGKLWMLRLDGKNIGVGLHSGVVADDSASPRFAMATELGALARNLNFELLS